VLILDSILLILAPISAAVLEWPGAKRDGNTIHQWLAENTRDEPADSHKSIFEIHVGTHIPEERVPTACLQDFRIFQALSQPGHYSIWRREPQSVYEKRGILTLDHLGDEE
jgi:hypothetical protein